MRDALVGAVLADPGDDLSVLALADWHEERGLCGVASALRLAASLRAVPYPDEPDGPDRDLVGLSGYDELSGRPLAADWRGERPWRDGHDVLVPVSGVWPWKCHGWNNVGRLPAFAAVRRMPLAVGPGGPSEAWRRAAGAFVACCELYACGAATREQITALRRAEVEAATAMWWDGPVPPGDSYVKVADRLREATRRLGGGPATRASGAMVEAERQGRRELRRLRGRQGGDLAAIKGAERDLLLLRTYHRRLVRTLLGARPWLIGPAVYRDIEGAKRWAG